MAKSMTHQQRARRYLRASMKAGYTSMPAEHREAYQAQMREHERAYPKVREHALAGADQDFDKPLAAGEREHQAHLRETEGLQHADVLRIRRELRERPKPPPTPARSRAALVTPREAAQAAVDPLKAAISGKGSLFLQIAGYVLGISLVYLLVAGKNIPEALKGVSNIVIGAAKTFIAPVDPITAFEGAIKAGPISPAGETAAIASAAGAASIGDQLTAALAGGGLGNHPPTNPGEVQAAKNYAAGVKAPAPSSIKARVASGAESSAFVESLRRAQAAHGGA
jgi:hypothetical protein